MATALSQRCCLLTRQILRSQRVLSTTTIATNPLQSKESSPPLALCHRHYSAAARKPVRRKRPGYGRAKIEGTGPPKAMPETAGMTQPLAYGGADGEDTEEYLKKTSLSPWVPTPDPIARKLFDMSKPTPEDIHVELGCGDGRVNFYAIDHGKVKQSIGIDVDDGILKQARERLSKRHPTPPIEFIQADLLDFQNDQVWEKIQQATILTMYFVGDALRKLKPVLEEKLAGKSCRIITVAYAMPGWNHTTFETTLGTTCYLYHWGNQDDMEQADSIFAEDTLLVEKPKEMNQDPLEQMRAQGLDTSNIQQIAKSISDRAKEDKRHYWEEEQYFEEKGQEEDNDVADEKKRKVTVSKSKSSKK